MMKRVFVAIDISDEASRKVDVYLKNLRSEFSNFRVSWERPEKLHLTLKFLGEIKAHQLNDLIKVLESVAKKFAAFSLQIAGTGQFGKRVLWLGITDKNAKLNKIQELLETGTEKIGFERETKSFKPHLTIARLREPDKSFPLVKKHLQNNFEPLDFEVSQIVIYESQLQSTGSVYKILAKHKLPKG